MSARKREFTDLGPCYIETVDYPAGKGSCGRGGWSRNARGRPQPVVIGFARRHVYLVGKTIHFSEEAAPNRRIPVITKRGVEQGVSPPTRRKANIYSYKEARWVRQDYLDLSDAEARARYLPVKA